ncbi:MAG: hypothetical protein IKF17_04280 [Clostridia bacterium]|nr:hypothetical protein [Clostridia bacterium]
MKKYVKLFLCLIVVIMVTSFMTISKATVAKEDNITDFLINNTTIDFENFKESDVITLVEELTNEYSTEDLADILEQYSNELNDEGLDEETLNTVTQVLRSTDTSDLRELLKEIDLDELKTRIDDGEEFGDIIEDSINNMPADQLIGFTGKFLLTNKVIKSAIIKSAITTCLITVYMIVVRWIIYKKAGKHGWAALIPIYKDVVWLKIAGLSPWLLLLFLIPIFGWIALAIVFIVSKFKVPVSFGQSALWGLGLWFIPIVFESVVAFSKEFEYIEKGDTEKNEEEIVNN